MSSKPCLRLERICSCPSSSPSPGLSGGVLALIHVIVSKPKTLVKTPSPDGWQHGQLVGPQSHSQSAGSELVGSLIVVLSETRPEPFEHLRCWQLHLHPHAATPVRYRCAKIAKSKRVQRTDSSTLWGLKIDIQADMKRPANEAHLRNAPA